MRKKRLLDDVKYESHEEKMSFIIHKFKKG